MVISQVAPRERFSEYETVYEKEFDCLALIDSDINARSCVFLEDEKYIDKIPEHASMVITKGTLADKILNETRGIVITEEPGIFFFTLHNYLSELMIYKRPKYKTVIDESARISNQTFIAEHNVRIGRHVTIEPFVTIHSDVIIGDYTIIRSGAIIGGAGFEFKRNGNKVLPVSHIGGVQLGEYVEIQNATCIDKAIYPWDDTLVGDYTKMDNAVHIGHAAKIGERVLFAAGATISGRVNIGDDTWIGVGTTIRNGISVGKNARVNIGAVVTKNVEDGGNVTGNFAISHEKFLANLKSQR